MLKIKQTALHKTKYFMFSKEKNQQNEKINYQVIENVFKPLVQNSFSKYARFLQKLNI